MEGRDAQWRVMVLINGGSMSVEFAKGELLGELHHNGVTPVRFPKPRKPGGITQYQYDAIIARINNLIEEARTEGRTAAFRELRELIGVPRIRLVGAEDDV
jgi:hypothetical protein